jgi:FkbM family methyltransferase
MKRGELWTRLEGTLKSPWQVGVKPLLAKIAYLVINQLQERLDTKEMLCSPVSRTDIVGAYKILAVRGYNPERLENLLQAHRRIQWQPFGVFLNLTELPEIADLLNIELQKEATPPIPISLSFGATVFGFSWDYFVSDFVRRNGFWEKDVQSIISRVLNPGDVAIDVGANIGCHAALMAHIVGPRGKVHAVEPVDYLFRSLEKMVAFNEFQQITLHKIALSNKNGTAVVKLNAANPGGNSLETESSGVQAGHALEDGLEQVTTRTIDEYLLPLCDRCDFIKIDVEGHEGAVLGGATELIHRYRPTVLFEFAPSNLRNRGTDPLRLLNQFHSLGMTLSVVGIDRKFDKAEELVGYVEAGGSFVEILAQKP